ncbi:aldo/keto reductase [Devosia sp.]|uniref:aldo/keto reductase n=1 Tax=Devosia sp. TaxID=1871048 RepID=UPI001B162F1D|nr:aldo/keto reductase [Devosia sp.]MBO9588549.1 aldo/keto reductase [Devosia sp.]
MSKDYTLNDGTTLPTIGLGTYSLWGHSGVDAMLAALQEGYRLLDSAVNYENEGAVGRAVRLSGIPREDIRVASKLPGRHHKKSQVSRTIEESLLRTGLDYLDLYLIHWPNPGQGLYLEAWEGMIEARERGLVRSIGVSNFLPDYLDVLIEKTGVTPSVNQIELHPYFNQEEQRTADRNRGILTQAWTPIGKRTALLEEPTIVGIARELGRTPAQVVLRWHSQLGVLPIPKSANAFRRIENLAIEDFVLGAGHMQAIAGLTRPDGRIFDGDPATHEEF